MPRLGRRPESSPPTRRPRRARRPQRHRRRHDRRLRRRVRCDRERRRRRAREALRDRRAHRLQSRPHRRAFWRRIVLLARRRGGRLKMSANLMIENLRLLSQSKNVSTLAAQSFYADFLQLANEYPLVVFGDRFLNSGVFAARYGVLRALLNAHTLDVDDTDDDQVEKRRRLPKTSIESRDLSARLFAALRERDRAHKIRDGARLTFDCFSKSKRRAGQSAA